MGASRSRVVFASAFRSGGECISHVSLDGEKTLCGRLLKAAEEVVVDAEAEPDCRPCARALAEVLLGWRKR